MGGSSKFFCLGGTLVLLMATLFCGCVTRSDADARVKAAYIAGQKAALTATGADPKTTIAIVGPVKHPKVPWVAGLTLVQAIATAEYTGRHNPKAIIITRHGVPIDINPGDLLNGHVVLLEPGDTINLQEQMPTPTVGH